MATQVVEFPASTGRTLTAKLFAAGSDTVVDSQSATEATNRKGIYTASFSSLSGDYTLVAVDGSGIPASIDTVTGVTNTAATFQVDGLKNYRAADVKQLLGTAWLTPGTAGTPDVNTKTITAGAINAAAIATDAIDADALKADAVTEIQSGLATQTSVDDLPTNAELATALAAADDAVLAELAKVPKSDSNVTWNATAAAQINAEVVDALATDTYAEPGQGTPSATLSLAAKIGYLFKAWRNRHTQTSSTYKLYNDDATTVDQKATFSDDATTADRSEIATGP